ncbi:MAG: hypothetical protein KBC36_03355 [Spirochaetia bacterium]|nr:hypothetical protein [Spirochaetia bacterium]
MTRNLGPFSFEAWIRDTRLADDAGRIIFSKQAMQLSVQTAQTVKFKVDHDSNDLEIESSQLWPFDATVWVRIGFTWDGSGTAPAASFFRDENPSPPIASLAATGARDSDAESDFVIGNNFDVPLGSGKNLVADLDEIRISNVARSSDWMRAQYLSQLGSELSFGTVEVVEP